MSKKRRNRTKKVPEAEKKTTGEKEVKTNEQGENVIDEIFGTVENEPDIETDISDLGNESEDDVKIAEPPGRKHKFFFALAVFVVIMAAVGIVSTVRIIAGGIESLIDNTSLKNEFTGFVLPVVCNDIAPFEQEDEITNSAKVNCAMWNILLNRDTSAYKLSDEGDLLIPEYDVALSYTDIFGTGGTITHQTAGNIEMRFAYDEENHVYTCPKKFRYLSYAPRIAEMTKEGNVYTLRVEYLPPSISIVAENIGIDVSPDKTMEYIIKREDGKNTLLSIRIPADADQQTNV